jgi:hypothetical protein
MKGGFWDTLTNAWESTKKAASDAYGSATGSTTTSSTYVPPPQATTPTTYVPPTSGGRKRSRKMCGGYGDNISLTNLASRAAPISDIKSAQPLNIVGGRRTKRRHGGKHRHGKSCKHRKY